MDEIRKANSNSSPENWRVIFEAMVCYAIAFIYLSSLQFLTPHMPGTDGFYHIKLAYLMRTEGIFENFPWAQFSLWRDQFFDKDFGFHLLLMPFTYGDLIEGAKWAAVTLGALVFASFYSVLRLTGVRWAALWTYLLLISGGYFLWRINVPRPQVLSITLSLWSIYFILKHSVPGTSAVSTVYALSYTAPHVTVIYALVHSVLAWLREGRWRVRLILAALIGIFLGSVLHPHFPNNFLAWKVQLLDVLSSGWNLNDDTPDLGMAGEFTAADSRSLLREHLPIYLSLFAAILLLPYGKRRPGVTILTVFVLANAFFIFTCITKRFVEYSVPLALWTCALIFANTSREALLGNIHPVWRQKWPRAVGCLLVIVIAAGLGWRSHLEIKDNFARINPSHVDKGADWLAENSLDKEIVFTCDWDDAPELFYSNHKNRYLVFLDPNYFYRWDAQKWRTWHRIANGRHRDPVSAIQHEFDARFGYCTDHFGRLRNQLERDKRAQIVGDYDGYFIFQITDHGRVDPDYIFKVSHKREFFTERNRETQVLDTSGQNNWSQRLLPVKQGWYVDLLGLGDKANHACIDLQLDQFEIPSPTVIYFGSDDDSAMWRDGELIYKHIGSREAKRRQAIIELKPKTNSATSTLRLRVCQERGDWGFYFEHQTL